MCIRDRSKQDVLNAFDYAYNKVDGSWDYQAYLDEVIDYLDAQ